MTAMRDHELIEQLLAAAALGGLDPADRAVLARERTAHGDACQTCRALERDYADVAGRLAFALAPAAPRPGLEDDLVARAVSIRRQAPAAGRAIPRPVRALLAAAAAVALFVGGWLVRGATGPDPLEGVRLVAFQGTGDLAMVYRPGTRGIVLIGSDLGELPNGRVLEVWMISDGTPIPSACFTPKDGRVLRYIDAEIAATDLMAVTVEPASCPDRPTSDPILTARLRAV